MESSRLGEVGGGLLREQRCGSSSSRRAALSQPPSSRDGDGLRLRCRWRVRDGREFVGDVDDLHEEAAARAIRDVLAGGELLTRDLEQVACKTHTRDDCC